MWLERLGAIRIGVAVIVAITAVAMLVSYPALLRDVGSEAAANDALSFSDREIAGGNGVVADQAAVYAARALIPEDESYHIAVGADYEGGTDLTRDHVGGYYRYFLMPRRPAESASWIVCYGCDLAEYGAGADVLWQGGSDISIVRVGT
jgi:hypothetical protein